MFDRVQVWGIGRQVAQLRARCFDCASNVIAFVSAEIVQHDDIARLEGWDEDLVDIGLEPFAVHRAVENHGRGQPANREPGREGGDFPMAMRRGTAQTPAAERPASEPYHIGGAARLIDEDQPLRVEAGLAFAPALPGRSHVRALLFAGQDGFFYN